MDWAAALLGFGGGVALMAILDGVRTRLSAKKEIVELQDKLVKVATAPAPVAVQPAPEAVQPETRATLMAQLGEATVELVELRRKASEFDKLKEEVLELRPKIETLAFTEAELDLSRAHAQRLREELARSNAEVASLGSENAKVKADLASHRDRLAAIERTTTALMSQLQGVSAPTHAVVEPAPINPETVAPLKLAPLEPARSEQVGDPLSQIPGVGPVFERRLWEAGVLTFSDLAAMSPEKVIQIIRPEHWQQIEAEPWITEARNLAAAKN